MLKNNIIIAFRNLWRNKLQAFINVAGLSIGISACMVLFLIVNFELGFEQFRQDRDRIYRVCSRFSGAFAGTNRGVPTGVSTFMADQFSGLEALTAFHTLSGKVEVRSYGREKKELDQQSDLVIAGPDYFEVFPDYKWISGTPEALASPMQVVLTEEKAKKYFGLDHAAEAVGRELIYNDSLSLVVAGVIADPPEQTDLHFQDFISFATIESSWLKNRIELNNWNGTSSSSQLFIKAAPGIEREDIEDQLPKVADRYRQENEEESDWNSNYFLQPFEELHFNSELGIFDNSRSPAHLPTLYALILTAVLLLIVAGINFVNLETAQAVRRAKEVGVRKVLGSTRSELVLQFLGETLLLTVIAVLFSIQLALGALRYFEDFIPDGVALDPGDPTIWLFLAGTTLVVALLSGAYPAFVLSAFRPIQALKDQVITLRGASRGGNLRRGLIVFQFIISQALIFGAFIVGKQISYMLDKDLGFNENAVIYFHTPWQDKTDKRFVLERELRRIPEILEMSLHQETPATRGYSTSIMKFEAGDEVLIHNVYHKFGDTAFIQLYDIPLIAGRNLMQTDTVREFLINETYARQLGFDDPAQALGRQINRGERPVPIVGVVRDFHIQSLHNAIQPVAIGNDRSNFNTFSLRLNTRDGKVSDFETTLDKIGIQWEALYPEQEFDYRFLDETLAGFYESEQQIAKLVRTATLIAILLSCLGLLGLISYTANQRTKEIGIRKVFGATVINIVSLLTKDFLRLVLLAAFIALPLAGYFIRYWLDDFAYRIDLEWWMFALAALAALTVALMTVSFRAFRAASADPVEALKYE